MTWENVRAQPFEFFNPQTNSLISEFEIPTLINVMLQTNFEAFEVLEEEDYGILIVDDLITNNNTDSQEYLSTEGENFDTYLQELLRAKFTKKKKLQIQMLFCEFYSIRRIIHYQASKKFLKIRNKVF